MLKKNAQSTKFSCYHEKKSTYEHVRRWPWHHPGESRASLVHEERRKRATAVSRSLQSWLSTTQSAGLTADDFRFLIDKTKIHGQKQKEECTCTYLSGVWYEAKENITCLRKYHLLDSGLDDQVHVGVVVAVLSSGYLPKRNKLHRIRYYTAFLSPPAITAAASSIQQYCNRFASSIAYQSISAA